MKQIRNERLSSKLAAFAVTAAFWALLAYGFLSPAEGL
jgi:hypothetical protein